MSKIFLTGASGYIGGQVLHELLRSKHDVNITALVRDIQKAETISKRFPQVRTVIGDLDNSDILEQEASQASIVLHLAATGHLKSVQSIHQGLLKRDAADPAYWIQVSGASALVTEELASPTYVAGSASSKVFDDVEGLSDLQSHIRAYPARAVDNYLLDTVSESANIKSALVFPPIIYGEGEGPVNQRSIQIPELSRVTLARGHGIRVGSGESRWGNVHVRDVGRIFFALAEAALAKNSDEKIWGKNGLYLSGVGEIPFAEISARIAQTALKLGHISSDKVEELAPEEYNTALPHGKVLFGTNARSNARRAKELLNWEPREVSLEDDLERTITIEVNRK
ncbi:Oxidase ucsJ [Cladobotryum mycophilum]|uniref:Oxidase ucsJ n=1 Tax=Cladobotryum mycophilum TaxID=491253 RepID=A0ABR0SJQ1_9HYPO